VLALSALGGSYLLSEWMVAQPSMPLPVEQTSATVRDSEEDVFRLLGEVRDLKMTLQDLRQDLDRTSFSLQQNQAQLEVERAGRLALETSTNLARLAEHVDQFEQQLPPPVVAVRASAPADGPAATGSLRASKPSAQARRSAKDAEEYVEGWTLREVNPEGLALVESRTAGLFGVRVGNTLPGVGRVEKVEQRGHNWVVVTSGGAIGAAH
jgi:hypothetical protein